MAFWDRKNKVSVENVKFILMVMQSSGRVVGGWRAATGWGFVLVPFRACRCLALVKVRASCDISVLRVPSP